MPRWTMGTTTAGEGGWFRHGSSGIPQISTVPSLLPDGMPSCWHAAAAGPSAQGLPQPMVAAGQEVTPIHARR